MLREESSMENIKRNMRESMSNPYPVDNRLLAIFEELKTVFIRADIEPSEPRLFLCSYIIYNLFTKKIFQVDYQEAFDSLFPMGDELREIAWRLLDGVDWTEIKRVARLAFSLDPDLVKGMIRFRQFGTPQSTPPGVSRLAVRLLGVEPDDRVADLCCGCGGFMVEASYVSRDVSITGYERNQENAFASKLRARADDFKFLIFPEDVFSQRVYGGGAFDKIFCHPPFRIKRFKDGPESDFLKFVEKEFPGVNKLSYADWLFSILAVKMLANNNNSKAICILPIVALRSRQEKDLRKVFVDKGLVETVIALPPNVIPGVTSAVSLLVFSRDNEKIRMIDASKFTSQYRGRRVITEDDLAIICEAVLKDSDISKEAAPEEIASHDFSLYPGQYFMEQVKTEETKKLKEIASFTRGVHWRQEDYLRLVTPEVTGIRYVNVNNVNDGMIDEKLPYLSTLDEKYKHYCVENRALLISKVGWKTAVAEVKDGEKLLVSNNFYIIKIDTSKADPYYIQAYLESPEGRNQLKSRSAGGVREFITIKDIGEISIPIPILPDQQVVVKRFKDALKDITIHRNQLQAARDRMRNAFGNKED